MRSFLLIPLLAASVAASAAIAQVVVPAPQNVLNLSTQATVEVAQDQLTVVVATTREGSEAATVQSQLKQALEAALAEARKAVKPGQLEVRTGQFSLYPRYSSKGGISGWQGRAELVIDGRDIAAISQLAGRVPGMVVASVGFGLSREARQKAESEVSAQAIANFKLRAEEYAKQFGFSNYVIREVSVGQGGGVAAPVSMFRAQALSNARDEAAPVPVEPGKASVSVTVSGSVQMSAR
ncbi:MAG: SIMPL domain-containing protein [Burkholderiales bacterium]|nr:SIMPL domain-containing protein [Burkholderiales bacterium]